MRVRVAKGGTRRRAGTRAGPLQFHLSWPDGRFWILARRVASKTAAELERRLAELEPDQLDHARVRAIAPVWGKAGGRRWAHIASWHPAEKEGLPAFVARALREAANVPQGVSTTILEEAWIDESDI